MTAREMLKPPDIFVLLSILGVAFALYMRFQYDMKKQDAVALCATHCAPLASRVLDDFCYCANVAGGFDKAVTP